MPSWKVWVSQWFLVLVWIYLPSWKVDLSIVFIFRLCVSCNICHSCWQISFLFEFFEHVNLIQRKWYHHGGYFFLAHKEFTRFPAFESVNSHSQYLNTNFVLPFVIDWNIEVAYLINIFIFFSLYFKFCRTYSQGIRTVIRMLGTNEFAFIISDASQVNMFNMFDLFNNSIVIVIAWFDNPISDGYQVRGCSHIMSGGEGAQWARMWSN